MNTGKVRLGGTGLDFAEGPGGHPVLGPALAFVDAVLRGIGQVVFLNNAYTGVLCLAGVLIAAPLQAAAALAGTVAATGTAMILRADRAAVQRGLYGFNGCLVAIALPLFLGGGALVWTLAILAAGLSSALLLALRGRTAGLPPLTAPFVLCSWGVIALVRLAGLGTGGGARSVPVPPEGMLAGLVPLEAALSGIAQVFLQSSPVSGAVIALGLLVGSRRIALLAGLAGMASAVVAARLDVPEEAIRAGLFGFNAILAAIAIGAVFLRPSALAIATALAAAALMPLVQTLCGAALVTVGLPVMSTPFILTTWVVLATARAMPARRAAS